MSYGPFLTDLDARASVKGSRDPLGIQQIWTKLGRQVIGNLTTVSNSLRDFTVLIVGLYLAERIRDTDGAPNSELETFLRWEQLAAYARAEINNDWHFRGTERVRKTLSTEKVVFLSKSGEGPILSDQKTYGLWGLYTVPARLSGLVQKDSPRLTAAASQFVESVYLPKLKQGSKGLDALLTLLRKDPSKVRMQGPERAVVEAVARVLKLPLNKAEAEFYREHLLYGGPDDETKGIQQTLALAIGATLDDRDFAWSSGAVKDLMHRVSGHGDNGDRLADRLGEIRTCEAVLAPVSRLFTYLLGNDGWPLKKVADVIQGTWGAGVASIDVPAFERLRNYLPTGDGDSADRWCRIAGYARHGKYQDLVTELVAINGAVMVTRGGASWVDLSNDTLHVRFREEQGRIPARDELPTLWQFPYFLDSLRTIAAPLQGV